MKKLVLLLTISIILLLQSGCSNITTTVIEQERVDQEIYGNRGYIYGNPPPQYYESAPRTRKYYHTEIEIPLPERKEEQPAK